MAVLMPLFHYFNVNDNIIILLACTSSLSALMFRGFATKPGMFFASAGVDFARGIVYAPIRAQMTRCISPHETGKVFAMLSSVQSLVPIVASTVFTQLYNATSDLAYPWPGSFYFAGAFCIMMGITTCLYVYLSLGCSSISTLQNTESSEQGSAKSALQGMNSNLHPEDALSKKQELFCVTVKHLPNQ